MHSPSGSRAEKIVVVLMGLVLYSVLLFLGTWWVCTRARVRGQMDRPLFRRDEAGAPLEGALVYRYASGNAKRKEHYEHGTLADVKWYSPGGDFLRAERFEDGTGVMVYLRDDGTPHRFMSFVNGRLEGLCAFLGEDGEVTAVEEYHDGKIERGWPPGAQRLEPLIVEPPSPEETQRPQQQPAPEQDPET